MQHSGSVRNFIYIWFGYGCRSQFHSVLVHRRIQAMIYFPQQCNDYCPANRNNRCCELYSEIFLGSHVKSLADSVDRHRTKFQANPSPEPARFFRFSAQVVLGSLCRTKWSIIYSAASEPFGLLLFVGLQNPTAALSQLFPFGPT